MKEDAPTNSNEDGASLLTSLSATDAWPAADGARIEVIQTHISMLFFVGDRVYKVKKPVDMGFLDYSTLEARRRFCEEEVRLNRRLAPDVYLGVRPITRDDHGMIRLDGEGETIDYAVEMQQLPADRMLDSLLERNEVTPQQIDTLVERLVDFHSSCATGAGVDEHATPDDLRAQEIDNLDGLQRFTGPDGFVPQELLDSVRCAMTAFIDRRRTLLAHRVEEGRVREGHGDLHAGNICLLDDEFVMYDCIEFSRRFRCRDVAAELSYLAMDFDRLGRRDLARRLLERYADRTDDLTMSRVARFYKAHFAIIRAKVLALKSIESEVEPSDRTRARAEATRFVQLAVGYLVPACLIVMCGLPGSGKSFLASALTWALDAEWIRTDVLRKSLAGREATTRTDAADREAIYSEAMTRHVYERMRTEAKRTIANDGRIAILDATHSSRDERGRARDLARSLGVEVILIEATAEESSIRDRLDARRSQRDEPSDADWTVYEQARERFEPTDEWEPESRLIIRTDERSVEETVTDALVLVARRTDAATGLALDKPR
ncbi:MAG: AAA family ATPase [Phycisphaerales bacterium]